MPVEVQAALYHKGFVVLRIVTGLNESRLEVRDAIASEIGLQRGESSEAHQSVARFLFAWESARAAEDKMKWTPRIVQCSEMAALRQAAEAVVGTLQDDEVPANSKSRRVR